MTFFKARGGEGGAGTWSTCVLAAGLNLHPVPATAVLGRTQHPGLWTMLPHDILGKVFPGPVPFSISSTVLEFNSDLSF